MMLRPTFPALRCITYGTPGSSVDAQTAEDMKEYVTSVCLGSDIVCRLSVRSLALLREEVLDCIVRCKVSKFTVTQSIWKDHTQPQDLMHPRDYPIHNSFKASVELYKAHINEQLKREIVKVALHIPGNVLHLTRVHSPGSSATGAPSSHVDGSSSGASDACSTHIQYQAAYCTRCHPGFCCCSSTPRPLFIPVEARYVDMETIYVSPTMVWDHLPDRYVEELQALHRRFPRTLNSGSASPGPLGQMDGIRMSDRALLPNSV
jgi:hypothetical protein